MPDSVAIFSGGLDSTVLVYDMLSCGLEPTLVTFHYGQKHHKEIQYASATAHRLRLHMLHIDITEVGKYLDSALTAHDQQIPQGHYESDSMKLTVVPNRNMIMLSIAGGIAASQGAKCLATAVHSGDHAIYPDCRVPFMSLVEKAIATGNEWHLPENFELLTPFIYMNKHDVVKRGCKLGVPFDLTWSCYKGEFKHCGKCGTCVERREAFDLAGVPDPTDYQFPTSKTHTPAV